jgi:carbonic anhydrase
VRTFPGLALLVALSGLFAGCKEVQAMVSKAAPAASGASQEHGGKASASKKGPADHDHAEGGPAEYALPFAWENSAAEPLGRARSFLKEMYAANGDYAALGQKLFPTYAEKQTPRATVVACSDSRVHTTAFDPSPENDDFMVRNIGNQVSNAVGSIQYGVEHLETPVLFILGHTGCGAVKAAMEGTAKLEKPIQDELQNLRAPKREPRRGEREAWVDAVVANVHDQVAFALGKFGRRVHSGRLTIVGGVLDFRNDLGLGAGRMVLVDVNGNRVAASLSRTSAQPMLIVTGIFSPWKTKGCSAILARRFSARFVAPSIVVSGSTMTNSSPP